MILLRIAYCAVPFLLRLNDRKIFLKNCSVFHYIDILPTLNFFNVGRIILMYVNYIINMLLIEIQSKNYVQVEC